MLASFTRYLLKNQVILALVLIVLGWFLFSIQEILLTLFISYIVMAALSSPVELIRKRGVSKGLAVFAVYTTVVVVIILLIVPLITFLGSQIQLLVTGFPAYIGLAFKILKINVNASQVSSIISTEFGIIGRNALDLTSTVFGSFFTLLTILVVSFYLLIEKEKITNLVASSFSKQYHEKVRETIAQVNYKLGAWLRGQIILSLSIGILSWIALTLLQVPFALPLAILAGMLEIVPTLGPILSAIPAAIVAISISPTMLLIVILVYIGIQMLENNLLVPKIMEHAVGLNPIAIIIGVLIGSKLFGVMGALLSVPFISMLIIIISTIRKEEAN